MRYLTAYNVQRTVFFTAEDTPGLPGVFEAVPARPKGLKVPCGFRPRAGGWPKAGPLTRRSMQSALLLECAFMKDDTKKTEQFYDAWNGSTLLYGKRPLEVYHEPYLIKNEDALFFKQALEPLQALVDKITLLFLRGKFREIFQFEPRLLDLILADPGYPILIPFSRWDTFYDGKNLKCLELNTDGTSGMVYVEELDRLHLETFQSSGEPCRLKTYLLETLLDCYQGFKNKKVQKPQIAIVDWNDVPTRPEQSVLCDFFNLKGYKTVLADPRALTYDGSVLWKDDFRIDLIYRRVVTGEYLNAWDQVKDMTQAYLDQNVCIAGSFRSQIGFDKRTFAILSSEEYEGLFSSQENELRRLYIPWTRILKVGHQNFNGMRVQFPDYLEDHPELFILKPAASNRGEGILFGNQVTRSDWVSQIRKRLSKGHIVQERLEVPKCTITSPLGMEKPNSTQAWGFHLGHFLIGGKVRGWMCRVGEDELLNDRSDDRLIPCLRVK